jgi:uncharacterized protein YcbK (DUF882 family)
MNLVDIPALNERISRHFTWKEALWLPQWKRMANEADGVTDQVLENLKILFQKMDLVREFIRRPVVVHCAYRPKLYNELVKGAPSSAHLALEPGVAAVDFNVDGLACMPTKIDFLPMLDIWDMRMERNGIEADWVHLDTGRKGIRYFRP